MTAIYINNHRIMTTKRGRNWRKKRRRNVKTQKEHSPESDNSRDRDSVVMAKDTDYIRLCQWIKMNGFNCRQCFLQPADFKDTGRGLMARREFKSGELVVSIPHKLLLTTDTVLKSYLAACIRSLKVKKPSPVQILCAFLICERHLGSASFWFPYIAVAPNTYTNPPYWTNEELNLLPESIKDLAQKQIRLLEISYRNASGLFRIVEETYSEFVGVFSFDAYRWAWCTVNTRTVYMKRPASPLLDQTEPDHYAMAPFLDLLNHSSGVEVNAAFNADSQCYEIRTMTGCQKYQQMLISYGCHDNNKLLVEYGFVLPGNPYNSVIFSPEDLKNIHDDWPIEKLEDKMKLIYENDFHRELACTMHSGLSWNLLTALRILAMTATEMLSWKLVCSRGRISVRNELQTKALADHLLSTSLDNLHIPQLENEANATYPQQMALVVWRDQKEILEQSLEQLHRKTVTWSDQLELG